MKWFNHTDALEMSLEEIIRSPWFYSSPSPLSLLFHGVIIFLCARVLRQRLSYHKHAYLVSLTDSFFVVGFIVLSGDFIWMSLSALRFLSAYPNNLFLVLSVLGRDAVGMLFCYLLQRVTFKHAIKFQNHTLILYFVLILYLGVNFIIAVDPTWTDWTYAIRQGCSLDYILKGFLVNWIGGKTISSMLVYSWFKS